MINLLPPERKKELRAAHANIALVRHLGIIVGGGVFIGLFLFGAFFNLNATKASAEQMIAQNEQKESQSGTLEAQFNFLQTRLSSAKTVLDSEIRYTKILTAIAQAMPPGTVMSRLNVTGATISQPIAIEAYARTTDDALLLRDQFQKSPIFTNVSFRSLSESGSQVEGYPVGISLNVTINKELAK